MRLISWNVRLGGGKRIDAQMKALIARKPDIVAHQEVTPATVGQYRERFEQLGLGHLADSFPRCHGDRLKNGRQFGVLLASRWKLEQLASTQIRFAWREKVLSAMVDSPRGKVETHVVHLPNGSAHGWTKIEMFEAIYRRLACNVRSHRILCGDFNSPLEETAAGQIRTFGQEAVAADGRYVIREKYRDKQGRGFPEERWDLGERSVLEGLRRYDLSDVFRSKHGYRKKAFSYYTNNRGCRVGRRFDHIFASSSLKIVACEDLQRLRRLSDYAPMEAVFDL